MLRVVVDPNVFVSAIITPNGVSGAAIRAGLAGRYLIIVCPTLVDELTEVLHRPKLAPYVTHDDATAFVDSIAGIAEMHNNPKARSGVVRDPADEYLVGLAIEANADLIATGDRDLHDASVTPDVLGPRELLERIDER